MVRSEIDRIGDAFRLLAEIDFRGASPLYERLATETASDHDLLSILLPAAPNDRLPHLLFAAVQYLLLGEGLDPLSAFGAEPFEVFRSWCHSRRPDLEWLAGTHVTQTNEVGRCAALLPCLAVVADWAQRPLALIEVGASAGLNLLVDRYRYEYGPGAATGPAESSVILRPRMEGDLVPPLSVPDVTWRRGLDRLPVDVADPDAVRWLRSCIWPEQRWRVDLLDAAVAAARSDPPTVVKGDVFDVLPKLVDAAPPDAALCVVHTAVLPYLPDRKRLPEMLAELGRNRPLWWVSGEGETVVQELVPPPATPQIAFLYGVVAIDGTSRTPRTLARAGAHGAWLEWLDRASGSPARSS